MKQAINLLLAVSTGLSAVLLVIILAGYRSPRDPGPAPAPVVPAPPPAKAAIDAETWNNLRSDDPATMVQRLRERGFPPEFIRAIIAAQLRELYADRLKNADPDADQRPFWKNYSVDPKVRTAQYRLYREQQDVLRTLLGADADPRENLNALFRGLRFDTVPAEKLPDVQGILRNFDEARNDLYMSAGGGTIGPEIQKRVEALQKEQDAALAQVLTPQELAEWNLRNSDTARSLRYQLSAFDASEAEYRTLFQLQSEFDQRFPRLTMIPSPEEQKRRSEAQSQLNEQIKAALGSSRGEEYVRATDFHYRQTSQLVARLELPPATTRQVYEVQTEISDKMNTMLRSATPPAEREAAFARLAAEAETRIASLLGARGFEAYRQYGGGWMQSLRPRPASKAATPPVPR